MLSKKKVIESIQELPASFSSEDVIDRIILLDKIQIGMEQSKAGKTYSLKQIENKLKKWLK
ncbi:MAG: hypothetical protein IPN36_11785 [Bacteroidetes bacterium]|nr:hypothetical protein [Bacteroidota bacterium]MBL0096922.1 hypothetical protein [Bacteroidota bacterium]